MYSYTTTTTTEYGHWVRILSILKDLDYATFLLPWFTEVKDVKAPSSTNKNDLPLDHHQHNGNIKAALPLYPDVNEKSGESQIEKVNDDDKNTNVQVEPKSNDFEIACSADENVAQQNTVDDREDEYEHSLWKWPSGRSCFTKVISDKRFFAYL